MEDNLSKFCWVAWTDFGGHEQHQEFGFHQTMDQIETFFAGHSDDLLPVERMRFGGAKCGADWDDAWRRVGPLLEQWLPNLNHLICRSGRDSEKLGLLFPYIRNITKLETNVGNHPMIFREMGSLERLEQLNIDGGALQTHALAFSHPAIESLANCIQTLPCLKEFYLSSWVLFDTTLNPVLKALQAKLSLERVRIQSNPPGILFTSDPSGGEPIRSEVQIDAQMLDAIYIPPRINQVIRNFGLPENRKYEGEFHRQWIEAMISVKDRLQLFHFFFSRLPPSIILSIALPGP